MPWQDRFSRAKFRDMEFLTESHEAKGGRRLVVHEYPGSNVPRVEDLGGKGWSGSLNAYFIGPDYDLRRNEFLARLARPGPSWLTHPWLGRLWVRPQEWSVSESSDKGGYCTVKVDFVDGGGILQPVPDRGDIARARAVALAEAAVEDFKLEPLSAEAGAVYVAGVEARLDALGRVLSLAALPLAWAGAIVQAIAGTRYALDSIARNARAYAEAFRGIARALGLGREDTGASARVVMRMARAAEGRTAASVSGIHATDVALARNLSAEYELERRLIVAAAASAACREYLSESERDPALTAVDRALSRVLPLASDPVFQAAASARAALIDALLAQEVRPTIRRAVAHPLPAVLIAHKLGIPEETFLERNAVRHPLFVNGIVHG